MRPILGALTLLAACAGGAADDAADTDADSDADSDDTPDTDEGGDDPLVGLTDELVPHVLQRQGTGWRVAGEKDGDLAVLALDSSLRPDASFGVDGRVSLDFGGEPGGVLPTDLDAAWALRADDDGLWVGGYGAGGLVGVASDFAVARLTAAGALDPSFGEDGLVLTTWGVDADVNALLPTVEGGVIAIGSIANSLAGRDVAGVRYDAAGVVVPSWGTDATGIVADRSANESAIAAFDDGDGLLVPIDRGFQVARFVGATGDLDPGWGTDGWTDPVDGLAQIALRDGDDLVLVGTWNDGEISRLRVVRRSGDGELDPGFSGDGLADVEVPFDALDLGGVTVASGVVRVRGAGLAPDGGLVAYLQVAAIVGQAPALVRLTPEGELDTSWQVGGGLVLPGAFALLEGGADVLADNLLAVDGTDAVIVDSRLRDTDDGDVESVLVTERHAL